MKSPVVCYRVSVSLAWLYTAYMLRGSAAFLFCYLFGIRPPVLELAGLWVQPGLSVEQKSFGKPVTD